MATVAAVHSQPPVVRTPAQVIDSLFQTDTPAERPKRPKPGRKRVWASLTSSKDTFINDVKAEITRRDPEHERTWVIVTDGERALQRRVIKTFGNVTLVLDLLHALDKLWKVAHVLHPDGSREAEAFVRQRAERILCGMVRQVVKGLRQTVTKRRLTGQKAKTIRGVADYLYSNRERMRYDHYLANGWPIASGIIEGACKTSSATDSNAPACAGRSRPPKHCCAYAPPTSPATTTTTADTTSQPTKPAYTATTTGKSS